MGGFTPVNIFRQNSRCNDRNTAYNVRGEGQRLPAPLLGFCEVLIWLIAWLKLSEVRDTA